MSLPQLDLTDATPQHQPAISDHAFAALARRLHDETGIVLSAAKKGLAVSRLSRRLRTLGLPDFERYCALLDGPGGAAEMQEVILLLTTNVTRFFREKHHFDTLRATLLPPLLAQAERGGRVRIWSAGCSSGEEAYSLAMTILDVLPSAPDRDVRVLATDIDRNMLSLAQAGKYRVAEEELAMHQSLRENLTPARDDPGVHEVSAKARSLVQFAELNLQAAWPMTGKFDIIFCRNVVIYFSTETQQALWPRFADALTPGGHLIIGHSERVSGPALSRLTSCGITQYQRRP